jgi:hypothetical protein
MFAALDEREIARRVAIPHDQARLEFVLSKNTVKNYLEFESTIGGYYQHHYSRCVAVGGRLAEHDAKSRAKRLLESRLRRGEGDIVTYYRRCEEGVGGGMRIVLDTICDALKAEAVTDYVRDVFDRHVAPHAFDQKVELIKQFFARFGANLDSSIEISNPSRYADSYFELINSFVESLQRTSSIFRRL